MDMEQSAHILRALGDKSRMQILSLLKNTELCGNDLLPRLNISQSTLSHHMKTLTESGLVCARKAGKATYYTLAPDGATLATQALSAALGQTPAPVSPAPATPAPAAPIKKKPINQFETWL